MSGMTDAAWRLERSGTGWTVRCGRCFAPRGKWADLETALANADAAVLVDAAKVGYRGFFHCDSRASQDPEASVA